MGVPTTHRSSDRRRHATTTSMTCAGDYDRRHQDLGGVLTTRNATDASIDGHRNPWGLGDQRRSCCSGFSEEPGQEGDVRGDEDR